MAAVEMAKWGGNGGVLGDTELYQEARIRLYNTGARPRPYIGRCRFFRGLACNHTSTVRTGLPAYFHTLDSFECEVTVPRLCPGLCSSRTASIFHQRGFCLPGPCLGDAGSTSVAFRP